MTAALNCSRVNTGESAVPPCSSERISSLCITLMIETGTLAATRHDHQRGQISVYPMQQPGKERAGSSRKAITMINSLNAPPSKTKEADAAM